jgi:hypothetical protein
MRRILLTKPTGMIAGGLLAGLLFATLAIPLGAQTAPKPRPYYDITREVTLRGTVSSVVTRPSRGMVIGSHLLLTTPSGEVDASLGKWGLAGKGALSVTAGQQVEVTGVMKTLLDREVFVARTVRVGGRVYTMRNEHGVPVSPQARERASQRPVQKGDSL